MQANGPATKVHFRNPKMDLTEDGEARLGRVGGLPRDRSVAKPEFPIGADGRAVLAAEHRGRVGTVTASRRVADVADAR